MSLGLGFSLRQTQSLRQTLALRQEQRILIRAHQLRLRLALLQEIRQEVYMPAATCSKCGYTLTVAEILDGFLADPTDYTTCCPKCATRFTPIIRCGEVGISTSEVGFYCSVQSLAQLDGKQHLSTTEFAKQHAALYHSAVFHFGCLTHAFKKVGVTYAQEDLSGWQTRVEPYLGKLPDTLIAQFVNVSPRTLARFRKAKGIAKYTLSTALAAAEAAEKTEQQ